VEAQDASTTIDDDEF